MLKIGLGVFLVLHGLLHVPGFLKGWELTALSGVSASDLVGTRRGRRLVGVLWLLACVAQMVSAALLLAAVSRWWMVAGATVVLSQLLIIGAWSSARAGTIANLLLVPPIVVTATLSSFHGGTEAAVRHLLACAGPENSRVEGAAVTAADLAPLPVPVKRWLEGTGIVGRPRARSVRLWQRGALRTSPGGAWMPAEAQQHFTVDQPGFVWGVQVRLLNVVPIAGRDSFVAGHGRMEIKLGGLVPMVDARGPKIDQGAMLRFLGEIVWFPSAALAPYIHWEPIDADHAQATLAHGGASVSAVFTFDSAGHVTNVAAQRYQGAGDGAVLKRWEVPCRAWGTMAEGIVVPVAGTVVWKEAGGDFEYFRWEVTRIESEPRTASARSLAQEVRQQN